MEGSAALKLDEKPREELESAVIRFAGDSGDGMQLTGGRFTEATAVAGNDLTTFPDFPAEIRAPIGTTYGVSAFQINFGSRVVMTAGDAPDVLVCMNPAALKVNLADLKKGGLLIIDAGTFNERNLQKAGFDHNPLENGSLDDRRVIAIDISKLTLEAVKDSGVNKKDGLRAKNLWTLGLLCWLYDRDLGTTISWLEGKFKSMPEIAAANIAALKAGHAFGETAELPAGGSGFSIKAHSFTPGLYRAVTGTEAMAWGLVAGTQLAGIKLLFSSYPITPASGLLHALARLKAYDVVTFQAEDEIAAIGTAIGASYAGALGVTSSSGPGVALKTEALGLAITAELPLVLVNSQRAGPSTGMPTKTEQSDLFLALYGRNADSPLIVLAARSSADCFDVGIEAVRLATRYMTAVVVLTDTYIVNAAEPWLVPDPSTFERFDVSFRTDPEGFHPYKRDPATLARPWVKPGTPGLEHRIGGLEKDHDSGNVSYDAENHQRMTDVRHEKIARVANDIPLQEVDQGPQTGRLAVVGWGSTYGPISRAVERSRGDGIDVAHIHLRHLAPLPRNLGDLLAGFDTVLVPEMNMGQLCTVLRSEFLLDAKSLPKVTGKPFKIAEIMDAIRECAEA